MKTTAVAKPISWPSLDRVTIESNIRKLDSPTKKKDAFLQRLSLAIKIHWGKNTKGS